MRRLTLLSAGVAVLLLLFSDEQSYDPGMNLHFSASAKMTSNGNVDGYLTPRAVTAFVVLSSFGFGRSVSTGRSKRLALAHSV